LMDGAHLPAEHFFRPVDELPVLNGVTLSYGTLGLRFNGSGSGVVSLEQGITNRVMFEFTLQNTGGSAANGALLFGEGSDAAGLVKAEVDITAKQYRISHGGNLATASLPNGLDPGAAFDITVTWDPVTATVNLAHGTNQLELLLASPPQMIDHVGYGVTGSQTDFTPATLHVASAPLVWKGWCLEGGVFHLAYERPAGISGQYFNEESTNLVEWLPARVLREQPVTGFGSVQAVSVDIRDRGRDPGAPASLFYRIRYLP